MTRIVATHIYYIGYNDVMSAKYTIITIKLLNLKGLDWSIHLATVKFHLQALLLQEFNLKKTISSFNEFYKYHQPTLHPRH